MQGRRQDFYNGGVSYIKKHKRRSGALPQKKIEIELSGQFLVFLAAV